MYLVGQIAAAMAVVLISGGGILGSKHFPYHGLWIACLGGMALVVSMCAFTHHAWAIEDSRTKAPRNVKPLAFSATTNNVDRDPGTKVAGIPWRTAFEEVQVAIFNPNEFAIQDLNLVIRPDAAIAIASIDSDVPDTSFTWNNVPRFDPQAFQINPPKRVQLPMGVLASE